jgi:hypothetical protein
MGLWPVAALELALCSVKDRDFGQQFGLGVGVSSRRGIVRPGKQLEDIEPVLRRDDPPKGESATLHTQGHRDQAARGRGMKLAPNGSPLSPSRPRSAGQLGGRVGQHVAHHRDDLAPVQLDVAHQQVVRKAAGAVLQIEAVDAERRHGLGDLAGHCRR